MDGHKNENTISVREFICIVLHLMMIARVKSRLTSCKRYVIRMGNWVILTLSLPRDCVRCLGHAVHCDYASRIIFRHPKQWTKANLN